MTIGCSHHENLQAPQVFTEGSVTVLVFALVVPLITAVVTVTTVVVFCPPSRVLRRSQLVSIELVQTVGGMLPERFGLDVRTKVDNEDGRDAGGLTKALF